MRADFHEALEAIDHEFLTAASLVAEALPALNRAFLGGDVTSVGRARELAWRVSDRARAVEDRGFVLLAREAPVGGDLRRLVALLRIATDVDRSASLLAHVSESLLRFDPRELPTDLRRQIEELADRSSDVFGRGVDAWRIKDALAVIEVDQLDGRVDRLRDLLLEAATGYHNGDEVLVLGLVARYYERIADHGLALARDAAFVVTGERVEVGR